jgi:N-acetylglucosaminyl-diphospho-decaprenol L-rhamnosyltransferase
VSEIELSYCVVNTDGREDLLACLDAIAATHPEGVSHELLVLDNASRDGSAGAVRERRPEARLIALERRAGKAENDSRLLQESRGRYCLLLNEDSELQPGAVAALLAALDADEGAAGAGAQLLTSAGEETDCAWRLPDIPWALAAALFLHSRVAVESRGESVREVGWAQSSAMLVRREAAREVGWLDPDFFVYSDETDFCKRLHDAGWRILYVPSARAVHHDQLGTDLAAMRRRVVEFHRNRDLYFRKHGMGLTRIVWRVCWTWAYLVRAAVAVVVPGRDPRRYLLHARQELAPSRGVGIREAAEAHNARLDAVRAAAGVR